MPVISPAMLTIENIRQALDGPLPGVNGQRAMAPAMTDAVFNRWTIPKNCREAGVLLLFYPYTAPKQAVAVLHLVLIMRPDYPGVHSGQVALPGGRREANESLEQTALRETYEEIGVHAAEIQLLGRLSTLYTPPSNFCIHPFVAFRLQRPQFRPDKREVAQLIEAPLYLFFDPAVRREEMWHFDNYGERLVPFFDIAGHKVWGATAMILSEFTILLRQYCNHLQPNSDSINS